MKIVGVRLKKGIHKLIKDTAKIYYFMCPIKNVGIGDYVLLECDGTDKINIFQVGLIIEEHDNTPENTELYMPFSFVVSGFPVKDFLARCDKVAEMRKRQIKKIDEIIASDPIKYKKRVPKKKPRKKSIKNRLYALTVKCRDNELSEEEKIKVANELLKIYYILMDNKTPREKRSSWMSSVMGCDVDEAKRYIELVRKHPK